MISDAHLAQLRALIESILDERGIKKLPKDPTAAERMRKYRASKRNVTALQKRNGLERNLVTSRNTRRNGHDVIGEGDIVATVPSLRGDVKVCRSFIAELIDAYPAVLVAQEIDRANLWLAANPTKRKANVRKFLTNWMARQQEKGGSR